MHDGDAALDSHHVSTPEDAPVFTANGIHPHGSPARLQKNGIKPPHRDSAAASSLDDLVIKTEQDTGASGEVANGHNETSKPQAQSSDLERISSDAQQPQTDSDANPLKRKRAQNTLSRSVSRAASPPWRLPAAAGPSSYTQNGIRKSARTNEVPLDMRPGADLRRHTRAERRQEDGTKPGPSQASYAARTNEAFGVSLGAGVVGASNTRAGRSVKGSSSIDFNTPQNSKRLRNNLPSSTPVSERPRSNYTRRSLKHSSSVDLDTSPNTRLRQKNLSPSSPMSERPGGNHMRKYSHKRRRISEAEHSPDRSRSGAHTHGQYSLTNGASPSGIKIKLRGFLSGQPRVPRIMLDQPPKQAYGGSFSAWVEHFDPFEGEPESERPISDEAALETAKTLDRLIEAAKPGGVLSEGCSTAFLPDAAEEPRQVYGHWNHVVQHALYLQKLMKRENREHVEISKKTATAAKQLIQFDSKDRFANLRPQVSQEEWIATQFGYQMKRARQIVKDMAAKWDLIRREVEKQRLADYEEQRQREGKRALDELLEQKMAVLEHRRRPGRMSSELASEDESYADQMSIDLGMKEESEFGTSRAASRAPSRINLDSESGGDEQQASGPDSEPDSDIMSTEEDDSEPDADVSLDDEALLTQEELRAKYAEALKKSDSATGEEEEEEVASQAEGDDASQLDLDHRVDVDDGVDLTTVKLEEVDPLLEEDEDEESGSETESDSEEEDEDEDEDEENDDDDEGDEGEEDKGDSSLLGFYGLGKTRPMAPDSAMELDHDVDELDLAAKTKDKPDASAEHHSDQRVSKSASNEHDETAEPEIVDEPDRARSQSGTTDILANGDASTPAMASRKGTPASKDITAATSRSPTPQVAEPEPKIDVSRLLRGTLREYQQAGLEWLASLYSNSDNGILADEMGLGKTIQTISLLCHLALDHGKWGPHLIVVPTSVILNWEMEFKKFAPGFKVLTYYGTPEERKRKRSGWLDDDMWNVIITSYQLVVHDAQAFRRRQWHYLILDEAHQIKNYQTQKWQIMLNMKTEARLLLTGTPLQNNLSELWSLLYFIMPAGLHGSGGFADLEKYTNMMKRPADMILNQGKQKLDAESQAQVNKFHEILRPHLLRRLKADVEKQMPAKYEHVVYCRMSKRQRELYDTFMRRQDTQQALQSGNYMSIMTSLMSLRKVCNHPDLFEERQIVTSFEMPRSAVASYEIQELFVRKRFLADSEEQVSFAALGLDVVTNESMSKYHCQRARQLQATRQLQDMVQLMRERLPSHTSEWAGSRRSAYYWTAECLLGQEIHRLESAADVTRRRAAVSPAFDSRVPAVFSIFSAGQHYLKSPDRKESRVYGEKEHAMFFPHIQPTEFRLGDLKTSIAKRSELMHDSIKTFSCTTPAVTAPDVLSHALAPLKMSPTQVQYVINQHEFTTGPARKHAGFLNAQLVERSTTRCDGGAVARLCDVPALEPDPFHEARIRQTIAFPDARLLQFDCGKLQRLAELLRELQAGGHRALIFTQMTRVLDVLEQFLNIHGHRYLRLDGATKIEQRQLLTERFNSDNRILCFILSSRSGGLGINLTGADTVIFYDMDWNPAMDKQCQDRCHRIGQTRNVHIYRFVSEHTIEANVLLKANQKRLLDEVIIQKGEFTTDTFNQRMGYGDNMSDEPEDAADAAMARILGDEKALGGMLQGVEDEADANAAAVAQQEVQEIEAADEKEQKEVAADAQPDEEKAAGWSGFSDPDGERPHVEEYMLGFMKREMQDVPVVLPTAAKDKKAARKARDKGRRR